MKWIMGLICLFVGHDIASNYGHLACRRCGKEASNPLSQRDYDSWQRNLRRH